MLPRRVQDGTGAEWHERPPAAQATPNRGCRPRRNEWEVVRAHLDLEPKKLCQQALLLYSVYACRILEVSSTAIECSMALSRHTSVTGFSYTLHNCACVSHPENNTSERFARSGARFTGAGTKPWSCRHPSVLSIPPLVQPRSCCRLGR